MDHRSVYELHCKHEFAELKESNAEILRVLKGHNGTTPGLIERVRVLEAAKRGVLSTILAAIVKVSK